MPRRRRPDRLEQLVDCAIALFSANGYRRTQMADIARALGVSQGALYGYVESKEALFDLAVQAAFSDAPLVPTALPVPTPGPAELKKRVRESLGRRMRFPHLLEALSRRRPKDLEGELGLLLGELYDDIAANRTGIRLIERCAPDRPELAELYFRRGRPGMIDLWRDYLVKRIDAGLLAPVPDPLIAARLVIETIAWFGWHRYGDPHPQAMDETLVRETVVRMLSRALLPR